MEKVREIIGIDANFTLRMLTEELNSSYCTMMKKQICVMDHPPYSPDLSPCQYFLFPQLKTAMKGAFYDNIPTIQATVIQVLKNIPKTEFKKSMDKLVDRSKRCIESNGTYFE